MAITNAWEQFETILRENLGNAVENLRPEGISDPFLDMLPRMEPLGLGGRESSDSAMYAARRKVKISRGGMVTGGQWTGNNVTGMGANDDLPVGQEATALAPDPEKVPLTQYVTLETTLKRILGNVTVNMTQILVDLLADDLDELAVGHIEDATFQVLKNLLAWMYSDGTGMIAQSDGSYTVNDSGQQAVGLKAGPYNRFIKGQRYWVYSTTSWPTTTTRKGGTMRCTNIDDNAGTVEFEMEAGETAASIVVNDNIVLAGSLTSGTSGTALVPKGIEYMFKETGAFFGLSDITQYPEFIAYIEGDEDNTVEPEPDRIAKLIDKIKKSGTAPPTMLVSEATLASQYSYTEKAGFATYVVPSRFPNPDGGVGKPVFTHGDIVLPWETSDYIRPGMLWGAAPDTILKFQPGGAATIRWWNGNGPGAGVGKIFVPVTDGTRQTELWQAPFETHIDFLAIRAKRNFRYVGLITQETA